MKNLRLKSKVKRRREKTLKVVDYTLENIVEIDK